MSKGKWTTGLCARSRAGLLLLLLNLTGLPVAWAGSIQLSHVARGLQPGEVILLSLTSEDVVLEAIAIAFDREFTLFPTQDQAEWQGLIGIDLNTKAGTYQVRVLGVTESDRFEERYVLVVQPKEFPVRRLTVDEKFVTPPPDVLERIQKESALVSAIFKKRTETRFWRGPFLRPVPGAASSSFGKRSILNGKPRSPHTGTDFKAGTGTPVEAPNAGRIVLAQDLYYAGNTVIIDHGLGLYSYFAHLSEFRTKEGETVNKGDLVGLVGSTGRVTGPHLHWTSRLGEARVDPLSLMKVTENLNH